MSNGDEYPPQSHSGGQWFLLFPVNSQTLAKASCTLGFKSKWCPLGSPAKIEDMGVWRLSTKALPVKGSGWNPGM